MTIFQGQKVVIIGAARQGLALARYLDGQGANVILNDRQPAEKIGESLDSLKTTKVRLVLGSHPLELLDGADLVCVSGGVPLTLPIILEAQTRQIPLTNDSEIFMSMVTAPVIAITGSAGKTTTTTLVGRMAQAAVGAGKNAWVGGNIGNPLIETVAQIQADDLVVLELSSFQLELMKTSPHIAAVLNITPNHLDRHGTMQAYTDAKSRILQFQAHNDIAILNREDKGSWALRSMVQGNLLSFGQNKPDGEDPAVYLDGTSIIYQENGIKQTLLDTSLIQLRGEFNLMNVIAACTVAVAMNLPIPAIQAGVQDFTGVNHRLEFVREWQGVTWVNNSIATAPERTLATLRAFSEPIVLLLGGRDKDLPWDVLSQYVHSQVDHVVIFGEAGEKIAAALGKPAPGDRLESVTRLSSLQDALQEAARIAQPGDVVLLSPGGTSYDAFRDFEERGEFFRQWVNNLV